MPKTGKERTSLAGSTIEKLHGLIEQDLKTVFAFPVTIQERDSRDIRDWQQSRNPIYFVLRGPPWLYEFIL